MGIPMNLVYDVFAKSSNMKYAEFMSSKGPISNQVFGHETFMVLSPDWKSV